MDTESLSHTQLFEEMCDWWNFQPALRRSLYPRGVCWTVVSTTCVKIIDIIFETSR